MMDGPGPSIVIPGPHEEFLNSDFGIYIGRNIFRWMLHTNSDARNMEVLSTKHHRVEHMSRLRHKLDMRRARVVPGKHDKEHSC